VEIKERVGDVAVGSGPTKLLLLEVVKDSKVNAELVEEVVVELEGVERLLEEMQVVEVVVVETHGRVAPSARSAIDPAICGLSASAANSSTKLRRRRRRLHRMRTNHSRPVVSIALRLKSRL
jgi:hypothetical protein